MATFKTSTGKLNININKGETFSLPMLYKDSDGDMIDLTGYTARGMVRDERSGSLLLDMTPYLAVNNDGSPTDGQIDISIDAETTAGFDWKTGLYDLEIVKGAYVKRLIEGKITIVEEMTRND